MQKMEITLTRSMINSAFRSADIRDQSDGKVPDQHLLSRSCPVAIAVSKALGRKVFVGFGEVRDLETDLIVGKTDAIGRQIERTFDSYLNRGTVQPTKFFVNVRESFLKATR